MLQRQRQIAKQSRSFFPAYTEATKHAADGEVEMLPLKIIAETDFRA